MDLPFTKIDLDSDSRTIEFDKSETPAFHCDLCDWSAVHKIADALLPGLASACIDNTSGDFLWSPGLVAANLKKEMTEFLVQRSETFVAESVVVEGNGTYLEASDRPYDIISEFVDDFAFSKRNFFSRVSGWLLSDSREDKIDDLVQDMEINGFWLIQDRESLAKILIKNVDVKNAFHCNQHFTSATDAANHVASCGFRSLNCQNEGCTAVFSACHVENHDSSCPFKLVPCEQKCSTCIRRHEMDRHCLTVCPMKTVSCPFYLVGCQSSIPSCNIRQHLSDDLLSHITFILERIHKDKSQWLMEEAANRLIKWHTENNPEESLTEVDNIRSLTLRVKEMEAQIGPLRFPTPKSSENSDGNVDTTEAGHACANENSGYSSEIYNKLGVELEESLKINAADAKVQT